MVKKRHLLLEELINEVADNPALWDKNHKEFKNVVTKTQAWNDILNTMRGAFALEDLLALRMNTVDDLKNQWKNLRDSYFRKKKVGYGSQTNDDDGSEKKEWIFFRMLKFLDHDETYDPAYRRIIRDGGVKYDLKRDDAFLTNKKRKLNEAPHWEAFTRACNRFAALAPKPVDDPCVAFGNYVGVQLQQMSPAHRKKVMSDIMTCICRVDESVEVVVSMADDDQAEAFSIAPNEITLSQDG